MQLTSGRSFTRLKNELPGGESLSMSMWDELRKTQEANEGFLSLQSCHHHVGVWCGVV